jgi:hypothetical protein
MNILGDTNILVNRRFDRADSISIKPNEANSDLIPLLWRVDLTGS